MARARLILDRRRDLINDRLNCATAAEAPLDEAQERYHFDNPTEHTRGAYQHSEEPKRTCFALYFLAYDLAPPLGAHEKFISIKHRAIKPGYAAEVSSPMRTSRAIS